MNRYHHITIKTRLRLIEHFKLPAVKTRQTAIGGCPYIPPLILYQVINLSVRQSFLHTIPTGMGIKLLCLDDMYKGKANDAYGTNNAHGRRYSTRQK